MRREGNKVEAPYAKLLGILKYNPVHPEARAEVPLLRGVAQYYRKQPEAALRKFDELMVEEEWQRPPIIEAIIESHRALCYEKLGRVKEGKPHHIAASEILANGSRLRALKRAKKSAS